MREDSDRAGQDEQYDDLLRQHILDQGAGSDPSAGMKIDNPEAPQVKPRYWYTDTTTYPDQAYTGFTPGMTTNTPAPPAPTPPPAAANTQTPPAAAIPGPPPTAASQIPPDLLGILNSLKEGITSFQAPAINYQPQTTPAYDDLVRSAIMDAIRQGQQPVNESDPLVAPLLAAVRGQGQRAKEGNQADLAERLSARHLLSSGAYDTGVERYNQGVDEATGGTLAQLMTTVLGQRQQRLMQAIQMGSNYLNADQARQLQAELANVNAALDQYKAKSSVGLGTLASLLQNQQFYDSLGTNIGMFASRQNADAGTF